VPVQPLSDGAAATSGIYLMSEPTRDAGDIELSEWLFSSSPRGSFYSLATVDANQQECEPLIASSSSSSPRAATPSAVRHSIHSVGAHQSRAERSHLIRSRSPSVEELDRSDFTMRNWKNSKFGYYAAKLAVEAEPGLTTTQLMLTNFDLKPVEPERRQWGAWNFVAFWIGMFPLENVAERR